MYRRNLDITIATIIALLGGVAAAKHLPGQVRIPLGVGLFFAPGYLWSEAILSQRLPGVERALTTLGMALIVPILGGFLFYGLHILLFTSAWIGMLVVFTLLGVVAVAVQRLRRPPTRQRPPQPGGSQRSQRRGGSVVLHSFVFGLAGLIAIGSVAYSVKSAESQKFAARTVLSMTQVVNNAAATNLANLSNNNLTAQATAAKMQDKLLGTATQAHLYVANYEGAPKRYVLKLMRKGKVTSTWKISLDNGQTWQKTIPWTLKTSILADLYTLPNTTTPSYYDTNGTCLTDKEIKALPAALKAEATCSVKT